MTILEDFTKIAFCYYGVCVCVCVCVQVVLFVFSEECSDSGTLRAIRNHTT